MIEMVWALSVRAFVGQEVDQPNSTPFGNSRIWQRTVGTLAKIPVRRVS
jgi:hypothetical protein